MSRLPRLIERYGMCALSHVFEFLVHFCVVHCPEVADPSRLRRHRWRFCPCKGLRTKTRQQPLRSRETICYSICFLVNLGPSGDDRWVRLHSLSIHGNGRHNNEQNRHGTDNIFKEPTPPAKSKLRVLNTLKHTSIIMTPGRESTAKSVQHSLKHRPDARQTPT